MTTAFPTRIGLVCALAIATVLRVDAETNRLPGLTYFPANGAIVCENGTRWDNRPLYCNERFTLIKAGEQPGLSGPMGRMYVAVARGETKLLLHQFLNRVGRYRPGRMEWELTDPRLPGVTAKLLGTTLANADGYTACLWIEGAQAGDLAGWCIVPPNAEKASEYRVRTEMNGFVLDRVPETKLAQIRGRFSAPVAKWEKASFKGHDSLLTTSELASESIKGEALIAWLPIILGGAQSIAVVADDNDPKFYAALVRREKLLDPAAIANAGKAFDDGFAHVARFDAQVEVCTPDPYFNAGVSASVAAAFGLFVDPCFVHGGSAWRNQSPGWRTMGAAFNYGFHDQVKRSIAFWGSLQVKTNKGSSKGVYSPNGCQQAGDSRFFGQGFIDYKQPPHYEFQTQFFDEAVRAWRATADPELEKQLLPMLELHLKRCQECFDPDGDGLYESYNNTWPNDSVWFNGGGTVEQSAYVYYGERAAADMQRRKGNSGAAAQHTAQAGKIQKALDRVLWLEPRGHYAAYVEAGGHRRVHDDAWIYSQHLPIEAGMATAMQSWQAMYYTEWAMERFPFEFGGEMRQTSNWIPGQWSIRETFPGDNFAMALGYFMSGQGDEGWKLLRGTMLHSMYGDTKPMKGYGNERGEYGQRNHVSPGGLSHPNCGIDFNDITSSFGRAVVEGVFGYQPDYPNGVVRLRPAFPSAWPHASIKTPDFSLSFSQTNDVDFYQVTLLREAKVQIRVPIRALKIVGVKVNDKDANYRVEPWAGCGMLTVEIPAGREATVAIQLAGRIPAIEPLVVEARVGEAVRIQTGGRKIKGVLDPQGALVKSKTQGEVLSAQAVAPAGHKLLMLEMASDVPWFLPVKLHLTDHADDARREAQSPRTASPDATWKCLDISASFNGDVRTIFKQKYLWPRPETCSMRIGYDGWSAWTFTHWKIPAPEIKLDKVASLTGADGRLQTAAKVPFLPPADGTNIAFSSLWDNWPRTVTVPVNLRGDAIWLLLCGSSNPMQLKIANAVLRFKYADGKVETLDLVPPENFWSLCGFGRLDYSYERESFVLPKTPPTQVQLGQNCRAILAGWKLRPGVKLESVTLEALSEEVVIGLMAASIMNP